MKEHRKAWVIAWLVLALVFALVALGAGIVALAVWGDLYDVLVALGIGGISGAVIAMFIAAFPL